MKPLRLIALVMALGLSTYGQAVNVTANKIKGSATAPSGACTAQSVQLTTAGVLWTCASGTWSSSGGGGTTINSTNGQVPYRVNSTTFGDSAISSNALNATGISVTSAAAGSGVTIGVTSSGTNEALFLNSKGSGNVAIGTTSNDGQFQVQSNISGKPAFYIKGYTTDVASQPLLKLVRGDGTLVSEISAGGFAMLGATSFVIGANGADLIAYNGAKIGWSSSAAVGVSTTTLDTGFARLSAGVVRATNGSTGAGQLLIGTSTDTADAQLSVYSQSTTRPSLKLRATGGTLGTQNALENYNAAGTLTSYITAGGSFYGADGSFFMSALNGYIVAASPGGFAFTSAAPATGSPDLYLLRDAANTLAQRNGTNAQTFRIYNTYTDASNYERFGIAASATKVTLDTSSAGTGVARLLEIGTRGSAALSFFTNNTDRWQVNASGHFLTGLDNTYDIGGGGANRPRSGYFGTQLNVGTGTVIGSNVQLANGAAFYWSTHGTIRSSADGVFKLADNAETSFSRLQFGGTTSSFPSLKRSSAALETKLADDSAYAEHRALSFSVNNACVIRSGSGTPESAVTGNVCDLYLRTDGGANTTLYIKESGAATNTGWIAK